MLSASPLWMGGMGNRYHTHQSPAVAQTRGAPLFSAALPTRGLRDLAVSAEGNCFGLCDQHVLAVTPAGETLWEAACPELADQLLLLTEPDRLVVAGIEAVTIYDPHTGARIQAWPNGLISPPAYLPGVGFWGCENSGGGRASLLRLDEAGQVVWRQALPRLTSAPPLIFEEEGLVVVGSGSYLRAYSFDGELAWLANQSEFVSATAATRADLALKNNSAGDTVYAPLQLDAHTVLAGLRWRDGYGLHLFDVRRRTVHPLGVHLPVGNVIALQPGKTGPAALIVKDWSDKPEPGTATFYIRRVTLQGQTLSQHAFPSAPISILTDAAGQFFVACSVTAQQWDMYHVGSLFSEMDRQCMVCGFSPTGEELFTWLPGGPLSWPMALGRNGELYVASEGKLWALG